MRKLSIPNNDLFMSDDFYDLENPPRFNLFRDPETRNSFIDYIINFCHVHLGVGGFMLDKRKSFRKLIRDVIGLRRPLTTAVFSAHGDSRENGRWLYSDGEQIGVVQDWAAKHDGNYDLIVLHSCNSGGYAPRLERSAVLYSPGIINRDSCEKGVNILRFPSGIEYNLNWEIGKSIDYDYSRLRPEK